MGSPEDRRRGAICDSKTWPNFTTSTTVVRAALLTEAGYDSAPCD
jgi:hypothetical protein